MMKLFLALLLFLPFVYGLTPLEAGIMEARVLETNTVEFTPNGHNYRVQEATGRLTWFPRDNALQDVLSLDITPDARQTEDEIFFTWMHPDRTEDISVEAKIQTRNSIIPVRKRIQFPLQNVPHEVERYLGTGEIVDRNSEIQKLAQELAAGKNDAYEVVFALADWTTTNVEYSLESLRAPAIQKASEVLESRWGKCDELTALFISLNRALGIPARFVAGFSYTNSDLIQEDWGGHGWAEVWLPEVGWIPFDVTYGEYGYLDAGHVKLKVSEDAKETSIDFSARGTGFSLKTQPLDIYVTPTQLIANYEDRIGITLDAPYRTVGFGSTLLILATIQNKKDYYVSTRLDLARTTNTRMLSDTYQNILLKPRETRTIPFLVSIDKGLDRKKRYEFPFRLLTRLGQEERITISVEPGATVYETGEFSDIIEKYTNGHTSIAPFTVTCGRSTAYTDITAEHECSVEGEFGSTLNVCNEKGSCNKASLDGTKFSLTSSHSITGIHTEVYTAETLGKTATFFVTARTVEDSNVMILITHPETLTADDEVTVEAYLNHTGADPRNLEVTFSTDHASTVEHIADLSVPARLQFTLPWKVLRPGENDVHVRVAFVDELGTPGTAYENSIILMTDVSFGDRIYFWLSDFGSWVRGIFS